MAPTIYQALGTYYVPDNKYGLSYVVCRVAINMADRDSTFMILSYPDKTQ